MSNKKYKVGIVGYGWVASAHIPAINATTLGQVTAVYSSRKLDPKELSAKHGGQIKVYNDYNAMLADPDIHVVSICSYPLRPRQAGRGRRKGRKASDHRKAALPLAGGLRAMQKAIQQAKVKTCVCFECRYSSQFHSTKAVIDQGFARQIALW